MALIFSYIKKYNIRILSYIVVLLALISATVLPLGPGLTTPQPVGKFLNGVFPSTTPSQVLGWEVVPAYPNLTFNSALVFESEPGTNRVVVGSRDGYYTSFPNDPSVTSSESREFLDITSRCATVQDGGNLGMVFHPDFDTDPSKRFVYIWYCARLDGASYPNSNIVLEDDLFMRLSRFTVKEHTEGYNYADPSTEYIMLNLHMYGKAHRGGGMAWDDQGFLIVTIGEQFNGASAQDISNTIQGGFFRIDVDMDTSRSHIPTRIVQNDPDFGAQQVNGFIEHYGGFEPASQEDMSNPAFLNNPDKEFSGRGYLIPNDNPFISPTGANFEEYCTLGNRSPHRLTKDPVTGRLINGDLGAGKHDEINILEPGELSEGINYGWPYQEGLDGTIPADVIGTPKAPIIDFLRSEASSIIGGYVYRGSSYPSLYGKYICGDYIQNRIFEISFEEDVNGNVLHATKRVIATFTPGSLITFGQDHEGEIYMCRKGGDSKIYKLSPQSATKPAPSLLSQTGAFTDLRDLAPAQGVIPYDLIVPFYSDSAHKKRWMVIPNDEDGNGIHDKTNEQIVFSENGEWQFPIGTVMIKHFEIVINQATGEKINLETRFNILGEDGICYGLSYKWNADQSDAEILADGDYLQKGLDEELLIATETGSRQQIWHYPSRSECLVCHNNEVGGVLGPNTRQLNKTYDYSPLGGTEGNQLETLRQLGIFSNPYDPDSLSSFLKLSGMESNDPIEERARSYLDVNCSYCHRPGTSNRAVFDARYTIPLEFQNLINAPLNEYLGNTDFRVIVPKDTENSMIHHRILSSDPNVQMPPLSRNLVDTAAVSLIEEWIQSLDTSLESSCQGLSVEYYSNISLSGTPVLSRVEPTVDFNWGTASPGTEVNANNFSARFKGEILPVESGTHTFQTTVDDGARVWINDQLIIDTWTSNTTTDRRGTINLNAGQRYPIIVEYYESTSSANLRLTWLYGNMSSYEVVPSANLCVGDVGKLNQIITFNPIGDQCMDSPDITMEAISSSGLPVSFNIIQGSEYLSLDTINNVIRIEDENIINKGFSLPATIQIDAIQEGNDLFKPAQVATQLFTIIDGSSSYPMVTNGTAQRENCSDCYMVTSTEKRAVGTIWGSEKIDLDEPFRIEFIMNFGNDNSSSDGITFAIHRDINGTSAIGDFGSNLAVNTLNPIMGVEFDTDYSGSYDISQDHITFWSSRVRDPLQQPIAALESGDLEDGNDHAAVITWDPEINEMVVWLDGQQRDIYRGDIRNIFGSSQVFYGFASATGNIAARHKVCIINLETTSSTDETGPSAPQNLIQADSSATCVTLKWQASTDNVGVAGYNVYQDGILGPVATISDTTATLCSLDLGSTYIFSVSAFDVAGNQSAQSQAIFARTTSCELTTTVIPVDPIFCNTFGSVSFQIDGAQGNTTVFVEEVNSGSEFSDQLSQLVPGVYSYVISDDNCVDSGSFELSAPVKPKVDSVYTPNCSPDFQSYSVKVLVGGSDSVFVNLGSVINEGNGLYHVINIPSGEDLSLGAVHSPSLCDTSWIISAPACNCPQLDPPLSNGDLSICEDERTGTLMVSVEPEYIVNWYNESSGGESILENSLNLTTGAPGTYYAETLDPVSGCVSSERTPVSLSKMSAKEYSFSTSICEGDSYEFGGRILREPGSYTDTLVSTIGCDSVVTLNLSIQQLPSVSLIEEPECSSDKLSYTITLELVGGDILFADQGNVTMDQDGNYLIQNIPINNNVTVTTQNSTTGCELSEIFISPECNEINSTSPIAYYPLDNDVRDVIGGNDGTLTGGTFQSDSYGGSHSLEMNGAGDHLEIAGSSREGFLHDPFTQRSVTGWIKPSNAGGGPQTFFDEGGANAGLGVRVNGGKLEASVSSSGEQSLLQATYPDDGSWHSFAVVFDQGDWKLYLDGAKADEALTGFTEVSRHKNPAHIGAGLGDPFGVIGSYYGGKIDEVRIYDVALSEEEIYAQLSNQWVNSLTNLPEGGEEFQSLGAKSPQYIPNNQVFSLDNVSKSISIAHENELSLDSKLLFSVYPNPFDEKFSILFIEQVDEVCQIDVFDMNGKKIFEKRILTKHSGTSIDANKWATGLYLINIKIGDKEVSQRVVKY